jgi:hypothetical protein
LSDELTTQDQRGRPLPSWQPRSPRDSKNKSRQLLDAINTNDPDALRAIVRVTVAAAKQGKPWVVQILMDRIYPVPRDRTVQFPLVDIGKLEDAKQATADVMNAVAAGLLTIAEGSAMCSMIADYAAPMIELVQEEAGSGRSARRPRPVAIRILGLALSVKRQLAKIEAARRGKRCRSVTGRSAVRACRRARRLQGRPPLQPHTAAGGRTGGRTVHRAAGRTVTRRAAGAAA